MAAELEHSAGRAQARGGLAAAAAFLEEAARLTLDPPRRAERALAAAQAKHQPGAPEAALALLAMAEAGPLDELQRARVDLLRAQIAFAVEPRRRRSSAAAQGGPAARAARHRARPRHLSGRVLGRLVRRPAVPRRGHVEVAKAAREAPAPSTPPRPPDLLLDGLALLITEGCAAGAPDPETALSAFRDEDLSTDEGCAGCGSRDASPGPVGRRELGGALHAHVRLARQAGALACSRSPAVAHLRARVAGSWTGRGADRRGADGHRRDRHANSRPTARCARRLAGPRGRGLRADQATIDEVESRGEGMGVGISHFTAALLYNGLGRYADALAAAELACEYEDLGVSGWALTELVEAAARSGRAEVATAALERLSGPTQAGGTDWALGIEARSRALVSDGEAAERLYREAIERLGRTRVRVELARAHLALWRMAAPGEPTPRRARAAAHRSRDVQRRWASTAFAERARRELLATGETVRKRTAETRDELTAQEAQIARLAGEGRTNPEIGAELFISPRTVEWHLRKVYPKLDISSRQRAPGGAARATARRWRP